MAFAGFSMPIGIHLTLIYGLDAKAVVSRLNRERALVMTRGILLLKHLDLCGNTCLCELTRRLDFLQLGSRKLPRHLSNRKVATVTTYL